MGTLFAVSIIGNALALFACCVFAVESQNNKKRLLEAETRERKRMIKCCYRTDDGRVYVRRYPEDSEPPDEIDVQTSTNPDLPLLYVAKFIGILCKEAR